MKKISVQGLAHPAEPSRPVQAVRAGSLVKNPSKCLIHEAQTLELEAGRKLNASV